VCLGVWGCDEKAPILQNEFPTESLGEVLAAEGLTEYVTLAGEAGLMDMFEAGTQLTLFVPSNAALAALPAEIKEDPEALNTVLRFHTLAGRKPLQFLGLNDEVLTAYGSTMGVEVSGASLTLTGAMGTEATITKPDLLARNGIIHVVDAVLMPNPLPGTVVEVATQLGLASFAAALAAARLEDDLTAEDAMFNVLAPNEAAFAGFTAPASADILANILLHHVVLGSVDTASITAGAELPTAAGTTVIVPPLGTTVAAETTNGTLTEVTAVALPPTTLEYLESNPDTSMLSDFLSTAPNPVRVALNPDTLGGDDAVTFFAPIDSALTSSVAPGQAVLERHIVIGHVPTSSLTADAELTTLNGTLTVNVDAEGNISVDDGDDTANVVGEVRTLSGVVHLIDAVLLP
jgi:transforming growth factor-beta-induced protein